MSLRQRVASDEQLARLLQIGMVLEEVNEARARRHLEAIEDRDEEVVALFAEASEESATHRNELKTLLEALDTESMTAAEIDALVEDHYAASRPDSFDDILYDQLCSEETAYKFYEDLINAIDNSDAEFSIGRDRVLEQLNGIRAQEKAGAQAVLDVMEDR